MKTSLLATVVLVLLSACGGPSSTAILNGTSDTDALVAHVRTLVAAAHTPAVDEIKIAADPVSCVKLRGRRGEFDEPITRKLTFSKLGDFLSVRETAATGEHPTETVATYTWNNDRLTDGLRNVFVSIGANGDVIFEETCVRDGYCVADNFETAVSDPQRLAVSYTYCLAHG